MSHPQTECYDSKSAMAFFVEYGGEFYLGSQASWSNNVFLWFALMLFPIVLVLLIYISDHFGKAIAQLRLFISSADRGLLDYEQLKFPHSELGDVAATLTLKYRQLDESNRQIALERERLLRHFLYSEAGIAKVAIGKLEKVHVFGNDYPTPDGTGVRDYIHVVDLARGHVCAIQKLETKCGLFICNLGTGHGYSVLDVIHAFEKACGKTLPYEIEARRPGDIAECYADPTKAKNELGWVAEYGIEEMCADSWNWQKNNPDGYHTVK